MYSRSYDGPMVETYIQPSSAFGATTESQRYFGPKGKKGHVIDIDVDITADMVGTTTVPEICVGTASADASYGRFRLGTAVGTGYTSAQGSRRATQVGGNAVTDDTPVYEDFTGHVKLRTAYIPADTEFFISRVAGVGGGPAGTGRSRVMIVWF